MRLSEKIRQIYSENPTGRTNKLLFVLYCWPSRLLVEGGERLSVITSIYPPRLPTTAVSPKWTRYWPGRQSNLKHSTPLRSRIVWLCISVWELLLNTAYFNIFKHVYIFKLTSSYLLNQYKVFLLLLMNQIMPKGSVGNMECRRTDKTRYVALGQSDRT